MESLRDARRRLWRITIFIPFCLSAFAADQSLPQPVAIIAFSATQGATQDKSIWTSVTFSSENSIAVGLCRRDCSAKECSLRLIRWESGALREVAQTPRFDDEASVHPASNGRILAGWWVPSVLYSADLSTVRDLSKRLPYLSPSGKTAVEIGRGSWRLYRLTDKLEPLREGKGDLRSVSDEALLIQEGKVMRVENIKGNPLGSFSVPDELLGFHSGLLGVNKLYLADCRRTVRVVDFEGKVRLKIHQDGLCAWGDTTSSADGRRILFDVNSHKASGLAGVLEGLRTITSFGMVGAEDVNNEEVRVVDTVTGTACFEWHRGFPSTYNRVNSAAISPSGEYVAIVTEGKLSIYPLPAICAVK